MLHLKSPLGRSLRDLALAPFQGTLRWWKLALYVAVFMLPGGSLGVLLYAWIDHRRNRHAAGQSPPALLTWAVSVKVRSTPTDGHRKAGNVTQTGST